MYAVETTFCASTTLSMDMIITSNSFYVCICVLGIFFLLNVFFNDFYPHRVCVYMVYCHCIQPSKGKEQTFVIIFFPFSGNNRRYRCCGICLNIFIRLTG